VDATRTEDAGNNTFVTDEVDLGTSMRRKPEVTKDMGGEMGVKRGMARISTLLSLNKN
jgi:hypothetical protein